jgi:nucleotide-binding universal stress UspA family protein
MGSERLIVVGVDGSAAGWRALEWSADHAELTGRRICVVHVGDTEPVAGTVDERAYGRELLDEAVAALAESQPKVPVATKLVEGEPAERLVELGRDADLLVVGRSRHVLRDILLGSVAFDVLALSQVPTVVVGASATRGRNVVVVGVSDSAGGTAALQFAFEEAERRGAEVVGVRSWSAREWRLVASAALPVADPQMWAAQERTILDDCVRPWREKFPSVPARTVLSGSPTELALNDESQGAALLVLGCRRADDSRLPRLGPIASWAAHHFTCPVAIVGHPGHAHGVTPAVVSSAAVAPS